MTAPPVFPTLNPGWSQIKRPKAGANLIAMSGTGRVVRATLWTFPLWEWDITWEYLPDDQAYGVTLSDFKDLLGFFLRATGMFGGFCYQDQDENSVTGQYIGLGDGVTTTFALSKTFGLGRTRTEPIGYLNLVPGFNAYVNGVFVNPLLFRSSFRWHRRSPLPIPRRAEWPSRWTCRSTTGCTSKTTWRNSRISRIGCGRQRSSRWNP